MWLTLMWDLVKATVSIRVSRETVLHLTVRVLPVMTTIVGQIESLVAQAVAPGANGPALLEQAQNLVNNQ